MLDQLLALVLPEGILDHFDLEEVKNLGPTLAISLREKNIPPPRPPGYEGKTLSSRGFKKLCLLDFPLRGKKVILKIWRRRWKVAGEKILLIRPLTIRQKGTTLVTDFADFLKELD